MTMTADEAVVIRRSFGLLYKVEFAAETRYGPACPECGGLEHDGVDFDAGPDRGHEVDCELRSVLDLIESLATLGDAEDEGSPS